MPLTREHTHGAGHQVTVSPNFIGSMGVNLHLILGRAGAGGSLRIWRWAQRGSSIQCDAGLCNGACSLLVEGRTHSTAAGGLKAKELGWTQAEGRLVGTFAEDIRSRSERKYSRMVPILREQIQGVLNLTCSVSYRA